MDIRQAFLKALKASLAGEPVLWEQPVTGENWKEIFRLAAEQNVLPMIYQSTYSCPELQRYDRLAAQVRASVRPQVVRQVRQTGEFLDLYRTLNEHGFHPVTVKGIICRKLYPHGDNRISGDEDLYIPEGTFNQYDRALKAAGMEVAEWDQKKTEMLHEISYVKRGGILRIELHKSLYDMENIAYARMEDFFADSFKNAAICDIDGVPVYTMCPTDHITFLILHALKHFIGSGFGIRQVCDLCLYANYYGKEIEWMKVLERCRTIRADVFTAALFQIGERYLNFDPDEACYPACWRKTHVDSTMLLDDLLDAGVFGASSMSRKHSSNITLNAVMAQKQGKKAWGAILKTVFPSAKSLKGRYPYLREKPYLLPAAWADRILKYQKEIKKAGKDDADSAVEIGNRRVELLKKYNII